MVPGLLDDPVAPFLNLHLITDHYVVHPQWRWAVQGPFVLPAALALHASLAGTTMAVAMGESVANMLQPFFALPLLAIAGIPMRLPFGRGGKRCATKCGGKFHRSLSCSRPQNHSLDTLEVNGWQVKERRSSRELRRSLDQYDPSLESSMALVSVEDQMLKRNNPQLR
jgi:hypothetical protein